MPKTTLPFDPGAYAPVAERIALFYERHTTGRIITDMVERAEVVVFKALVYRSADDGFPAATGWASERVGDGEINAVACVENTETSAIGRALANLGFTASNRRPSAEEMEKASRERARLRRGAEYASYATRPGVTGVTAVAEPRDLHGQAEAVTDLLVLLRAARHSGLRARRADWIETRVRDGALSPATLDRVGRRLRRWIATTTGARIAGLSTPGSA